MSIKTLRKRIALVAVSALGAGVLSVAVVPSANAGAFGEGATSVTMASTTAGVCQAYDSTARIAVVNRNVSGAITLPIDSNSRDVAGDTKVRFTITGPAVWNTAPSSTLAYSADSKVMTISNGSSSTTTGASITLLPTGDGEVKITPATIASTGVVTSLNAISIYLVSACDNGSYSATTSKSKLDTSATTLTASSAAALTGDTTGASKRTYSEKAHLALWLTDKYGAEIDETGSYLTASATNGVEVSFDNSTFTVTAVKTSSLNDAIVSMKLPTGVTAPTTSTVTVALNGVTVATRTVTFTGQPASIVVTGVATHIATTATDTINFVVLDSAKNQLAGWLPVAGAATSNVNGASVTAFTGNSSATTVQTATLTAGSSEGASSTTIRVKLDDGSFVVSPAISFTTTTATAASWTISADKQIYVPGEVVTITIEAKNAAGNPVADTTVLASSSSTISWQGAGLTKVTADPAHGDTATSGKWTYKFYASTTEGSYGYSLKTDMAAAITTAQTGTFTVKSGAISNAEVLASIVKLIAAINKQIRALQKSLRR